MSTIRNSANEDAKRAQQAAQEAQVSERRLAAHEPAPAESVDQFRNLMQQRQALGHKGEQPPGAQQPEDGQDAAPATGPAAPRSRHDNPRPSGRHPRAPGPSPRRPRPLAPPGGSRGDGPGACGPRRDGGRSYGRKSSDRRSC